MSKKDKGHNKETIMDLSNYLNKEVNVEFNGGRRVKGTLKSFDNINNLILDNVIEYFSQAEADLSVSPKSEKSRQLGLVFARGPEVRII